jgi:hypothetical protein
MSAVVIINAIFSFLFKMDLVDCKGMHFNGLKMFINLHLLYSILIVQVASKNSQLYH